MSDEAPVVLVLHFRHVDYDVLDAIEAVSNCAWTGGPIVLKVPACELISTAALVGLAKSLVPLTPLVDVYQCDGSTPPVVMPAPGSSNFEPIPMDAMAGAIRRRLVETFPRERTSPSDPNAVRMFRIPTRCDAATTVTLLVVPKPSFEVPNDRIQAIMRVMHDVQYAATDRDARLQRGQLRKAQQSVSVQRLSRAETLIEEQRNAERMRLLKCHGT